jgi:hypothetical protein
MTRVARGQKVDLDSVENTLLEKKDQKLGESD